MMKIVDGKWTAEVLDDSFREGQPLEDGFWEGQDMKELVAVIVAAWQELEEEN